MTEHCVYCGYRADYHPVEATQRDGILCEEIVTGEADSDGA